MPPTALSAPSSLLPVTFALTCALWWCAARRCAARCRRIRSINKLIRVGRTEVVVVLRVDKEKGYIDLSKRRVSPEDIIRCEEKYNKSKAVHSIMRHGTAHRSPAHPLSCSPALLLCVRTAQRLWPRSHSFTVYHLLVSECTPCGRQSLRRAKCSWKSCTCNSDGICIRSSVTRTTRSNSLSGAASASSPISRPPLPYAPVSRLILLCCVVLCCVVLCCVVLCCVVLCCAFACGLRAPQHSGESARSVQNSR